MKLFDDMQQGAVAGFGFSAVRPETLGATEYTLVTLVIDKTGSVAPFAPELLRVKRAVVEACRKSARAEFLLLRLIEFDSCVIEVHGFLPVVQIDPARYVTPACGGATALIDAAYSAVAASNAYAGQLADQDYLANAIVVIVTDGADNASRMQTSELAAEIVSGVQNESLESLRSILVGVNAKSCSGELARLRAEAGIDQYVDVADADPAKLARLADFISRSVSAQSQSLGTGGPSLALTF